MTTVTKNKSSKLRLAAANAAAALALHADPAARYKASIARLEARQKASDDPGEKWELLDQALFVCRMARAEVGVDLGGHPFKAADIVRYWQEVAHKEPTFGFGALRSEALAECRYLRTATLKPGTRTATMIEGWRQLAKRPDVPAEIAELFEAAGVA